MSRLISRCRTHPDGGLREAFEAHGAEQMEGVQMVSIGGSGVVVVS